MNKILFLTVILFTCCNTSPTQKAYPREKQVKEYLSNVHGYSLPDEALVFILQSNRCGACTDFSLSQINKFCEKRANIEKVFILANNDENMKSALKKYSNSRFFIDKEFNMETYGLDHADNLIAHFVNKSIKFWSFTNTETEQMLNNW